MKVPLRALLDQEVLLKLKSPLSRELNSCTKPLRMSLVCERMADCKSCSVLGMSTLAGHRSGQQCGQWVGNKAICCSSSLLKWNSVPWLADTWHFRHWFWQPCFAAVAFKQKRLPTVFSYFNSFSNTNLEDGALWNSHRNTDYKMLAKFKFLCSMDSCRRLQGAQA